VVEGVHEIRSLADPEAIDVSELDAIIPLAGEPIVGWWNREKKRRILESRTDLTSDLVASIARVSKSRRPEGLVSVSAIGYYGDRGDAWLDEEADVGFGFLPVRIYSRVLGRLAVIPVPAFLINKLPGGMGRLFWIVSGLCLQ